MMIDDEKETATIFPFSGFSYFGITEWETRGDNSNNQTKNPTCKKRPIHKPNKAMSTVFPACSASLRTQAHT